MLTPLTYWGYLQLGAVFDEAWERGLGAERLHYLERPLTALTPCGERVELSMGLVVQLVKVWESPAILNYALFEFCTQDGERLFIEELQP